MSAEIVIDVGCMNHGVDSTSVLIDRFAPGFYYGFDPLCDDAGYKMGQTLVSITGKAAWLYDGYISFRTDGDASRIDDSQASPAVPCFDFGEWLEETLCRGDVILKLDCEGAEFGLIDAMMQRRQLDQLKLLLVEWHLPCKVEEWTL